LAKTPSDAIQKRALDKVTKLSKEYDSMISNRRAKWLDWYKMYRLFRTEKTQPWMSKFFIPKIFEIVEQKTPMMIAHNPKYIITPRFNDNIPYMQILRDYLSYVWDEEDMNDKIESWVKDMLIYGTGIGKVDWKQITANEVTKEERLDEITDELITEEIEEEVVRLELPTFDTIDIFDFKTDPRFPTLEQSEANIHSIDNVSLSELMADEEMYFNLKNIKTKHIPAESSDTSEQQEKRSSLGISTPGEDVDENKLNVKEYWGLFSMTGKPEDETECTITTVNDEVVIRVEKNDMNMRPFIAVKAKIVPHEFYGIGEVEPLEDLQIELNTIRRQRMDYTNSILNPEWLMSSSSGINPTQLVHKPNNIIIADDMNGLKILEKPGVPMAGYNEEAQILRDIQTVSQTTDVTDSGGSSGFQNTATGVSARVQQQSRSANNVVKHLEKGIAEIGKKFLLLSKYNITEPIQVRREDISEETKMKFSQVEPSIFRDVENGYIIKVEAGSTLDDTYIEKGNKAVARGNTAVQFLQAGVPIDMAKIWMDIERKTFMINNPEDFLSQPVTPEGTTPTEQQAGPEGQPPNLQLQPTLPPQT